MSRLAQGLVLLVAGLASRTLAAQNAPRPITVMTSVVGSGAGSSHELLAAVADVLRFRPAVRQVAAPIDESALRACGSDEACAIHLLQASGAELGVRVTADLRFDPALIAAQLLDVRAGKVVAEVTRSASGRGALSVAVADATRALLDEARYAEAGRLVVSVQPSEAQVLVSPSQIGGAGPDLALSPGAHQIQISCPGYQSAEATVDAEAGRETVLAIALAPESSSAWPWLIAGAAVIAAVGIGAGLALVFGGGDSCLCLMNAGGQCNGC